jgi:signal transduction histidine kinase
MAAIERPPARRVVTALSTRRSQTRRAAGALRYHPFTPMNAVPATERRLVVLVVDDIGESRRQLCSLVAELGHEAVGADSGAAALKAVDERRPDVVLLDLLMPDLDGFEVTRRIRSRNANVWLPVIVTSSLQGDEHFIHALESGADDFLTRPVNVALLEAKLRHYRRVLDLQSRLEALAERQRRIHDNILDAVITVDSAGTIAEANLAACRIFGSGEPACLLGLDCEPVLGAAAEALQDGVEMSLRRADGSEFPASIRRSEWSENGHLQRTLVVRDLTEQRRVERMKEEFLATVSHELRTPLTSVLGALGLLAAGAAGPLPPGAVPLAEAAQRNGHRLSRLIDDILDLTKLEDDRLAMHLVPTAIGHLVQEACAANLGYAQRVGVSLGSEVDPSAAGVSVRLDASRFLQVMANLLSNAIKHSPAGETVTVSLRLAPGAVRVLVSDRGRGIDPEFRARMFEKFSQADGSDRRAQGGTGLGLYISRMLVERMGGRIGVEPASASGTVFSVEFPVPGPSGRHAAPWVLVVDSDTDARTRVSRWIEPLCEVAAVASLAQAEERARGDAAPIVVGDTRAQGEADVFCGRLRGIAAGRRVILYSDSVDERFARSMGVAWVRKASAGPDELLRLVREAIAEARRREAG